MEVPEICRKPAKRQTRKRKSEAEKDPDYCPAGTSAASVSSTPTASTSATPTGSSSSNRGRKQVRRSKALEETRSKPPLGLNFIERQTYSVEDWKKKAVESQSRRTRMLTRTAKALAAGLRDVDGTALETLEYPSDKVDRFASSNVYQRYLDIVDNSESSDSDEEDEFNFFSLPKFVMGTGKGTPGGPAEFEYRSLWDYELDHMTPDLDDDGKYPWEKDSSEPDVTPEVLSIVSSFTVGCELDLKTIAQESRNIEFNPDRFAPLIMRIREPKSTGLIFRTGRVIVTGTRSQEESRRAARKYARVIQKFGYKVRILNFEVQNILASCTLKFRVRLNQLSRNRLYGPLSYEPELFPGLLIPLENPKVKVIIFCTGSVLMTGAKSVSDMNLAFKKVFPLLRMYAP